MSSDTSGLIAALRGLVPSIAATAAETERQRKVLDENFAAIAATGAFRFFVPKRFGGFEHPLEAFVDIGLALGQACASTAWITTFCMEHNWMLAQFPQRAQEEIFGSQPYVIAPGAISPNGRAKVHGDGYVLDGRWQWGTGVMHSDWALLSGIVEGTGELKMFVLPISDVAIIDVWHVDGMAGTGSNDMVVKDLFVPGYRSQSIAAMTLGRAEGGLWHGSLMYRMPMLPILYLAAGVPAIGAAQGALKRFAERAATRTTFGSTQRQSERTDTQIRLGHARGRLDTAELIARHIAAETTRWGMQDDPCPVQERVRQRILMAQAVRLARDVVRDLFEASGASSHLLNEPLQRAHRDVHTIASHTVFDHELIAEQYGRLELGLAPTVPV
jgi:3-hydroxy-9,10-secoandrosta-1,3,5(10)-triene-9,17-dione monooxygenase